MRIITAWIALSLAGCTVLEPNTIPVEFTHVSHATQHFTARPTGFGYDAVMVGAKWTPTRELSLKIEEGISLNPTEHSWTRRYGIQQVHGDMLGPREVFSATVTYEFRLK